MEQLVWSTGEKYERSSKKDKPILNSEDKVIDQLRTSDEHILRRNYRDNEKLHDEFIDRQMVQRAHQNPFFNDANYINVLNDQEKFLTPINSNNTKEEEPPSLPYNKEKESTIS